MNLENRKLHTKKKERKVDEIEKKKQTKKEVGMKTIMLSFYFEDFVITGPDFWFNELEVVELALVDGGGADVEGTPLLLLPAPAAAL